MSPQPILRNLGALRRMLWLLFAALISGPASAAWVATPWAPGAGEVFAMERHHNGDNAGILVGGSTFVSGAVGRGIVRLHADTLAQDTSFVVDVTRTSGASVVAGEVQAIAVDNYGLIIIGGRFDAVNGEPRSNIARLLPDGTLDSSFTPTVDLGAGGRGIYAIVAQPDSSVVIGGGFSQVNGEARPYLARINGAGSLDIGFADAQLDNLVTALALQTDGAVIVGGLFSQAHGTPRKRVVRLTGAGLLDPGFSVNPDVQGWVNALYLQPNGQVLLGGYLTSVGGQPRNGLARLNGNGALDTTFTVDTDGTVYAFSRMSGGAVVIGGNFTSVDGVALRRLAKVDTGYRAGGPSVTPVLDPSLTDVGIEYGGFVVNSVLVRNDSDVLVGGAFAQVDEQTRSSLAQVMDAPGVPLAPTITQAEAGDGTISLTIAPPVVAPAEPITGYDVACTPLGPGVSVVLNNVASPALLTGLTNGIAYACTARARNALGYGPAAAAPRLVTPTAGATPAAVPTLSGWSLLLLGLAGGWLGMRRARQSRHG